jgi:HPt (histidine-containing phosphotransfer) domain-containing protein
MIMYPHGAPIADPAKAARSDPFQQKIFDKNSLMERIGHDEELYREIGDMFKAQMPEALYNLRQAVLKKKNSQVVFFAHFIKGQCANMGAFKLHFIAEQIERLAKLDSDNEPITALLPLLKNAYNELIPLI